MLSSSPSSSCSSDRVGAPARPESAPMNTMPKILFAPLIAGLLLVPCAAMAEGMPQLDFKNPLTISQVVWGAIICGVLYVLASRVALRKVGEVLEERASRIAADL